jgi:hypothetical protein
MRWPAPPPSHLRIPFGALGSSSHTSELGIRRDRRARVRFESDGGRRDPIHRTDGAPTLQPAPTCGAQGGATAARRRSSSVRSAHSGPARSDRQTGSVPASHLFQRRRARGSVLEDSQRAGDVTWSSPIHSVEVALLRGSPFTGLVVTGSTGPKPSCCHMPSISRSTMSVAR